MENLFYVIGDENSFEDLRDALEFIEMGSTLSDAIGMVIEVHKKQEETHKSFVNGDCILHDIHSAAWDEYSDYAEDYLTHLIYDKAKVKELEDIITEWLNKNAEQPTFYKSAGKVDEIIVDKDLLDKFRIVFK